MSASFKPIPKLPGDGAEEFASTDANLYWNRMKEAAVFQEPGNLTSVDFSPVSPYNLASTSSIRLAVFDSVTCDPVSIYSRFKSPIYCATYRPDGALLGVGTQEGRTYFFDVHADTAQAEHRKNANSIPIRTFHAHNSRINSIAYQPSGLRFASMDDAGKVKLFDLSDTRTSKAEPVWQCKAHKDRVMHGLFSTNDGNLLFTGSYDHKIRLWDVRADPIDGATLEIDHGAPVERLLLFPDDKVIVSAGGPVVKLWDLSAGGLLLQSLENHHKTVTSLAWATDQTCIVSGGLDRRICVIRARGGASSNYPLIHSIKTAAPVLVMDVSPDDQSMAIGMTNTLSIRRRRPEKQQKRDKSVSKGKRPLYPSSVRDSDDSSNLPFGNFDQASPTPKGKLNEREKPGATAKRFKQEIAWTHERGQEDEKEVTVELSEVHLDQMNLGKFDYLLRARKYRELVTQLMQKQHFAVEQPEIIVAALQQLRIRQVLHQALAGQSTDILLLLFKFLRLNLYKNAFFDVLFEVTNAVLLIYAEEEMPKAVIKAIQALKESVTQEVQTQKSMSRTVGELDMIIRSTHYKHLDPYNMTNMMAN